MMQAEWKAGPILISDEHVHPIDKLAVRAALVEPACSSALQANGSRFS
jgi:hypothetical protein